MSGVLKVFPLVLLSALCTPAQKAAPDDRAKPVVLQRMRANFALAGLAKGFRLPLVSS